MRTRRGADRITKQVLQAEAIAAETFVDWHLKQCRQCQQAGTNYRVRCGIWWEYARVAHRARRRLRQYAQPETTNIDTLPGMD